MPDELDAIEHYLFRELAPMQANVMTGHGAGVRRTAALLSGLGDPQEQLRVIHVAGTAGKGSVCAFVSAVLEAHGHTVGRYLSPHAHTVLERFAVRGESVGSGRLGAVLADVRAIEQGLRIGPDGPSSTFEVATATAFELFRRERVDYAVIETGMGGLHDATNVVKRPDKLAVITALGLDHVDILGRSISEIAEQKAGILPLRGRALAVSSGSQADAVMGREAFRRRCRLDVTEAPVLASQIPARLRLGLPGRHQRVNAALALDAAAVIARRDGWLLRPDLVSAALASASLPGRFEQRVFADHTVVLDGAHNPMKLRALLDAVRDELTEAPVVWVLGVKPDKDLDEILRLIVPLAGHVIATEFGDPDDVAAVPAHEIAAAATRLGLPQIETEPRPAAALARAVALSEPGAPIVVTGSFHTVAAVGRVLEASPAC